MNIPELFKKTLILILSSMPRGTKSTLADSLEIHRVNFSNYLNGNDTFSEQRREAIATYLGFNYIDFLNLSQRLFDSDEPCFAALDHICKDAERFSNLVDDTNIGAVTYQKILADSGRAVAFPENILEKICEALIITPEEFRDMGRRAIISNLSKTVQPAPSLVKNEQEEDVCLSFETERTHTANSIEITSSCWSSLTVENKPNGDTILTICHHHEKLGVDIVLKDADRKHLISLLERN